MRDIMRDEIYFICLIIGAGAVLALFSIIPSLHFPDTQEYTVDVTHFALHDNASGSQIQGAMFAGMSEVSRLVVITAYFRFTPKDFRGVEFCIPRGWRVTEKYNSYPGGKMDAYPDFYIAELYTADTEREYNRQVIIEPDLTPLHPGEGNEGYVVVTLQPENDAHPPDECRIIVGVGSDGNVIYPTYGEYSVNFSSSGEDVCMPTCNPECI